MHFLWEKNKNTKNQDNQKKEIYNQKSTDDFKGPPLSKNLEQNKKNLTTIYSDCDDVVFRELKLKNNTKALICFIGGLTNVEDIAQHSLKPLLENEFDISYTKIMLEEKLPLAKVSNISTITECVQAISNGATILLIDKEPIGFSLISPKWEKRGIEEPQAESVVRGPREGFIETLQVNTALLRRKIKSPKLKMKSLTLGTLTQTQIVISYIEGVADETLIEEVINRISRIEIDGILESGYIEEFIQDSYYSPFPQLLNTERPDVVAGNLLEGRVAILVDGTPFVLVAPMTWYGFFQANEDYYVGYWFATFIRILRFFFLVVALLLPSVYAAILSYHPEMIPTTLLISIAATREPVPFPAIIEVLIMQFTFEALREAGTRLPKQVGAAVSIVGALVIGEAAVSAGLVSPPMVIVVAITGISSFMVPRYNASIVLRLLSIPMILLAGTLGLLGVMFGTIIIVIHLCTLRSFGVPYLSPLAPLKSSELSDAILRDAWWKLGKRPHFTGKQNQYRQKSNLRPGPTKGGD